MIQKIYFATDHAGFELKETLVPFVRDVLGYDVVDCGAYTFNEHDDFTDFIAHAARAVAHAPDVVRAIILGGSGQGEAMLANRFHGVRAAVYYGGAPEILTLSREHNDANVLSLGARFIDADEAKKSVMRWLSTAHTKNEKYDRRIKDTESFSMQEHGQTLKKNEILPSLPANSFEELSSLLSALSQTVDGFQVDMVDGVFVPHTSWPFTESDPILEIHKLAPFARVCTLEADLMCMNPERYMSALKNAGILRVVVHQKTTENLEAVLKCAREHMLTVGVAFLPNSPLSAIEEVLPFVDFIQIMGILHVGTQGEPFATQTLDVVRALRERYPELTIGVDGSVNLQSIEQLVRAGANKFAPGSAVSKATDPVRSYKQLQALAGSV